MTRDSNLYPRVKRCRFCDHTVPKRCTGKLDDHCEWCGGPIGDSPIKKKSPISNQAHQWCSDVCFEEDSNDPDFSWLI